MEIHRTRDQELLWSLAGSFRHEDWASIREVLGASLKGDEDVYSLFAEAGRNRLLGFVTFAAKDQKGFLELAQFAAERIVKGMSFRHAHQTVQLSSIATILQEIPFLLLKGLAVANAYQTPYLRPCGDIDLLILSSNFIPAIQRLTQQGFEFHGTPTLPWPPPAWLQGGFPISIDEIVLQQNGIVIELHPQVVSSKVYHRMNTVEFMQTATSWIVGSREISIPGNEEMWLHLALNYRKHRSAAGLGGLIDLAVWEDRRVLDISRLREKIERWKIGYLISPVLAQLKALFPDLRTVQVLGKDVEPEKRLFELAERARSTPCTPWFWISQGPQQWRMLWRNIFLTKDTAALRYGLAPNDPRLLMRRMVRPAELLRRHLGTVRRELSS